MFAPRPYDGASWIIRDRGGAFKRQLPLGAVSAAGGIWESREAWAVRGPATRRGTGLASSGRLWHDARAMLELLAEPKQQMSPTPTPRQRFRPRYAVCGCLLGLAAAVLSEAAHVAVGHNFHAVVPGKAYRSAQPTAADLERAVRAHGVCTV